MEIQYWDDYELNAYWETFTHCELDALELDQQYWLNTMGFAVLTHRFPAHKGLNYEAPIWWRVKPESLHMKEK